MANHGINNKANLSLLQGDSGRPIPDRRWKKLSVNEIRDLLNYDPFTGVFRWKKSVSQRAKAGAIAGYENSRGYISIGYNYAQCSAHILAWVHWYGQWPDMDIDHIDGDPKNNSIANLRLVTKIQNAQNRKIHRNNKTGMRGVTWYKPEKKWQAHISIDGKQISLGRFVNIGDAMAARLDAEKRSNGLWRSLA